MNLNPFQLHQFKGVAFVRVNAAGGGGGATDRSELFFTSLQAINE